MEFDENITDNFIVTVKNSSEAYVNRSFRIRQETLDAYNNLSAKTGRSTNELVGLALEFALKHVKIQEK